MNEPLKAFEERCQNFFAALWPGEEKPLVFGRGKTDNPCLMLIGEAPGEQEVMQGKPFVGKAGKNLDAFLQVVNLPQEAIYISNTVKIRPTQISPKGRMSNRPPSREEIGLFVPFLLEEIGIIQPRMLVTLGNVALKALAGDEQTIGQRHGQVMPVHLKIEEREQTFDLFPLYHPASVIYNPALKDVYARDLALLATLVKDT